jgi:hypothetical protein
MTATTQGAPDVETSSPLVRQINNGNWLPQQEAETLRAELFY